MSTLVFRKTSIIYAIVSVACFIFAQIYHYFGHGVTSRAMSMAFLYPLLGGFLLYLIIYLIPGSHKYVSRLAHNLYNPVIAILTVASILDGVFEIAGTASEYTDIMRIVAVVFLAAAVICVLVKIFTKSADR